ncbi:MAG TPA: MFS transporter [Verrucomicrobiae bacterium]|nr:MFS transporter [Verrucomicrobiae bacterium]
MRNLTALVVCVAFVDTVFFAALAPLLPHLVHTLALGKGAAGFLTAAYAVGSMAGTLVALPVAARGSLKVGVVLGLALMAACTLGFALAHGIVLLDGMRFGQGVGDGLAWTGAVAWLVTAVPAGRRGRAIGTAAGASAAGSLLGPLLGGIAATAGLRPVFGGIAAATAGLVMWTMVTPAPAEEGRRDLGRRLRGLLGWRAGAGLWLGGLGGVLTSVLAVLAPLQLARAGLGAGVIAAVFFLAAVIRTWVNPLLGRWTDRRGHRRPVVAGLAASALVSLLLVVAAGGWELAAAVVLAGAAFSSFWVPAMSMISVAAGGTPRTVWVGFGLWNLAWAVGWSVGSAGGGTLAAAVGDLWAYLALAGASLVTLALVHGGRWSPFPRGRLAQGRAG